MEELDVAWHPDINRRLELSRQLLSAPKTAINIHLMSENLAELSALVPRLVQKPGEERVLEVKQLNKLPCWGDPYVHILSSLSAPVLYPGVCSLRPWTVRTPMSRLVVGPRQRLDCRLRLRSRAFLRRQGLLRKWLRPDSSCRSPKPTEVRVSPLTEYDPSRC